MKGLRLVWLIPAALMVSALLVGGETFAHQYTHPDTGSPEHLHIDADITNGSRPCDPIDEAATVAVGQTHQIGVCFEGYTPNSVAGFELHVIYAGDPGTGSPPVLNLATEVDCGLDPTGKCLEDNPNANDGDDPSGFKLGDKWDCSSFGIKQPYGDDPDTPNTADAFIVCVAKVGEEDLDLAANPGLLATIEFTAQGAGDDVITIGTDSDVGAGRSCGAVAGEEIGCFGATIHKGGAGQPTPTPVEAPAASPTTTGPGATPTPLPPGMEAEELVSGCNPVASTYPDGTPMQTVASNVGPAGILTSVWKFELGTWLGYSPQHPEVSDLTQTEFLDALFICVGSPGTFVRPVV